MGHSTIDWSKAHTSYRMHDLGYDTCSEIVRKKSAVWRSRQEQMPHGKLIAENAFFKSHKDKRIYLVHGTSNLDAIKRSGVLHASAGCLVGSIYCSQAFKEGDSYRIHNLGNYIFSKEVPGILGANELNKDMALILIELVLPQNSNPLRVGIDYLKMGQAHFDLYKSLIYLLSGREKQEIEAEITYMVTSSIDFLAYNNQLFLHDEILTTRQARLYIQRLNEASRQLPMLGYLYFEAISEFLMLNSLDENSIRYAALDEFNNWLYKDLMYEIYSNLKSNFDIHDFNPTVKELEEHVKAKTNQGQLKIDFDEMITYVAERLVYWINTRFFSEPGTSINFLKTIMSFDGLSQTFSPLIGHCIHRQLRSQNRYKDFYFYFDHTKALDVWNYWNKSNVFLPFNGVFPKGEVGINPAITDADYKMYLAVPDPTKPGYFSKAEELSLSISPRLVDLNKSFMRAGGHYSLKKQKEIYA